MTPCFCLPVAHLADGDTGKPMGICDTLHSEQSCGEAQELGIGSGSGERGTNPASLRAV